MRILRGIGIVLALLILGLVGLGVAARFADGPIALYPGGPLVAGEWVDGDVDWTFAREEPLMELQLLEPGTSRTVWLLVHDRRLFIVSGYMDTTVGKLWKKWPMRAEADGRAVVRLDGKLYAGTLVRILDDHALFEALSEEAQRKYHVPLTAPVFERGGSWLFEWQPRQR